MKLPSSARFTGLTILLCFAAFLALQPIASAQKTTNGERLGLGVERFYPGVYAADCEPSYSLLPGVRRQGVASPEFRDKPHYSMAVAHAGETVGKQGQPGGLLMRAPASAPTGAKQAVSFFQARFDVPKGASLYGVGLEFGPLERSGKKYEMWNLDAYGYGPSGPNHLYESHPWVLAVRPDGTAFGVLADTTYDATVDLTAGITFESAHAFPVIVIERNSPQGVVQELAKLTGTMPMPPKWALGYQQCHYSYAPQSYALSIARQARENHMPCDVLWLDIDYMDHYRDFSFDPKGFPNPDGLNAQLHGLHFHDVWMIDSAVRAESNPDATRVFSTGTAQKVWSSSADGTPYLGGQWPSRDADVAMRAQSVFPDFTAPRVRAWWASLFPSFLAHGIDGVWNDMNEPAVFRSADDLSNKTMPLDVRHAGDPSLRVPRADIPQGASRAAGDHARYHNVWGMLMAEATREGAIRSNPDKRPFVLSRSNYIGGQKYAAAWTGDNTADWEHLKASIPMVLDLGLSGQPFSGPDIGGYHYPNANAPTLTRAQDSKLFARWMGFAALFPFARAHSEIDFGPHYVNWHEEPWAFDPQTTATCRLALERRYRLIPYLYTLFRDANSTGLPIARPIFFADPADPTLRSIDNEFLLGDNLLIAAQVNPTATAAPILPKGVWQPLAFHQSDNPAAPMDSANADLPKIYLRGGSIVPSGPISEYVDEYPNAPITLLVCLDASGRAAGTLYEDSGNGYGYQKGDFRLTHFAARRVKNAVIVDSKVEGGQWSPRSRTVIVRLLLNGKEFKASGKEGGAVRVALK